MSNPRGMLLVRRFGVLLMNLVNFRRPAQGPRSLKALPTKSCLKLCRVPRAVDCVSVVGILPLWTIINPIPNRIIPDLNDIASTGTWGIKASHANLVASRWQLPSFVTVSFFPMPSYKPFNATRRLIIVDDSNPLVTYIGDNWTQVYGHRAGIGLYGDPYNNTLHQTIANDSFSFSFNGTYPTVLDPICCTRLTRHFFIGTFIRAFGTVNAINTSTGFDPSYECFLDNKSAGTDNPILFATNNWILCNNDNLVDGQHTLTVKVKQATDTGRTFWFDYFQYAPSIGVSTANSDVLFENSDPAVVYSLGWEQNGDIQNLTRAAGSECRFNFIGMYRPQTASHATY